MKKEYRVAHPQATYSALFTQLNLNTTAKLTNSAANISFRFLR